jgi:hypothetical protein
MPPGRSLRYWLDAFDRRNTGEPMPAPPPDPDPEGTRILRHIRDLIEHGHCNHLIGLAAVHLNPYDAGRASWRIKSLQQEISGAHGPDALPPWAAPDAPPARTFYGVEIIPDETVPRGQIRAHRGYTLQDYTMAPLPPDENEGA